MTDQAQTRPGHEHVTAVRARLQQQRWAGIEWWQATDTDDEGLHRRRGASNPASVIADVLEAAAELGLLAGHAIPTVASATRIVLERITQAAEAYLTRSAEAVAGRGRAELRRHLADATTDAWMLLRPNSAGAGPDQDAPPARQDGPGAANAPESVAQYPPEPLRGVQAVPDDVLKAARAAAWNAIGQPDDLDLDDNCSRADAAAGIGWNAGLLAGRQQAAGALAYETTCLRCAQQLDQLAAERAAGIEEGRREAQRELDGAMHSVWLHANWTWLLTKMTTEEAGAAQAAQRRHQQAIDEVKPGDPTALAGARLIVADGAQPDTTITAADLERGAAAVAASTWPGPDLAEVGKWAQDFTTDEDGAPGSVSELDEHVWEEWGRTVGARTDRDRYRQLTILAAWVVATMRELRLREEKPAAREADAPSEIGPSEPTSNSDPGSVGASPALDRALALLHDVLDDHWLDIPGRPAGQPGAMRILDGGQLAGWRQRMAAIEEAAG